MVKTYSDYVKCLNTRRKMAGSVVYMNEVPVTFRSSTQKMVSLSTAEVELNAILMGAHDALFMRKILKSLGLKEKLFKYSSFKK